MKTYKGYKIKTMDLSEVEGEPAFRPNVDWGTGGKSGRCYPTRTEAMNAAKKIVNLLIELKRH